jgi:uncharacterized membrane protein YgcG
MSGTTDSYNNYDVLGNNNNSNNSDLASVHSGGSYHTNGSWNGNMHDDEFTYDSGDMLSSWELSGRWNDMISRSMNNISGGETQLLQAQNHTGNGGKHQPNDDYLLENPFNDSNIFHHWDDFTVKVEPQSHKHHSHHSKVHSSSQQDNHRSHGGHHHHHHRSQADTLNYDDLLLSQLFNKSCGIASSDPLSSSSLYISQSSLDESPRGKSQQSQQLQQRQPPENDSSYHYQYVSFSFLFFFSSFLICFLFPLFSLSFLPSFRTNNYASDHHQNNIFLQKPLECPERPYHLTKTYINLKVSKEPPAPINELELDDCKAALFESDTPLQGVINMITCYLSTFSEYDFSFFPKQFVWKGKYLQGSSYCLINIHLYKNTKNRHQHQHHHHHGHNNDQLHNSNRDSGTSQERENDDKPRNMSFTSNSSGSSSESSSGSSGSSSSSSSGCASGSSVGSSSCRAISSNDTTPVFSPVMNACGSQHSETNGMCNVENMSEKSSKCSCYSCSSKINPESHKQQQQQQLQDEEEDKCDHYILEANRIAGDSKPFHDFFREFRGLLLMSLNGSNVGHIDDNTNHGGSVSSGGGGGLGMGGMSSSDSMFSYDEELYSLYSPRTSCAPSRGCSRPVSLKHFGGGYGYGYGGGSSRPVSLKHHPTLVSPPLLSRSGSSSSSIASLNCLEYEKSIEPILNMTKCPFYEIKLEALKMLCDIINCENFLSVVGNSADMKTIDGIFKSIENLILHSDGFLMVKEQAIVAFASFTDTNSKDILMRMTKSPILHILLQLVNNPSNDALFYETAQMRRESARVLSTLASFDSKLLLSSLESQSITLTTLKKWYDHIDLIRDSRTRLYAQRIRELLTTAVPVK